MHTPSEDLSKTRETFGNIVRINPTFAARTLLFFESNILPFGYVRKFLIL